jgi:hypothetical protein
MVCTNFGVLGVGRTSNISRKRLRLHSELHETTSISNVISLIEAYPVEQTDGSPMASPPNKVLAVDRVGSLAAGFTPSHIRWPHRIIVRDLGPMCVQ